MTKKRKRHKRAKNPKSMRLMRRDIDIVEAVHKARVLSQAQIQQLFFGPRAKTAAERRLRLLYDHAYLERKFLPVGIGEGRSPTLYVLDRKGAELLRAERGYDELVWHRSSRDLKRDFLAHTMAINEVMVAVTVACRAHDWQLEQWLGENDLKADYDRVSVRSETGRTSSVAVIPDSYFAFIAQKARYRFFLELDRGTMTTKRFRTKVQAYLAYRKTAQQEKRFGSKRVGILTVIDGGERRLANLKETTERARGGRIFWFATLSALTAENIFTKPVWAVAGQQELAAMVKVT
jgi:hypothetical protein